MKEEILTEIGLSESEKKVYLTLLDLGDSTRGQIVNKSGVTGSKIYELLEKLQNKGLVSIYIKDKVRHFKPTNPKQLLHYLQDKKNNIAFLEKQAQNILPELLSRFSSSKEDQEVELISGMKGLDIIFREQVDTLKKGETCYVIGGTWGTGEIKETLVQSFFEKISMMREKKKIKTKMLFNKSQKETTHKLYGTHLYPSTKVKYFEHTAPVAINIYKNKTIIIIFGKQITSIYIKSQDVANSFIEYFNLLWKSADP
jgi:sugar-specific transcriptional regulator TrmB